MLCEEAPQLALAAWLGEWDRDLVHLVRVGPRRHHLDRPGAKVEARNDLPRCAGPLGTGEPLRRWVDVRARQLEAVEQAEEKLAEPGQRRRVVRAARFV